MLHLSARLAIIRQMFFGKTAILSTLLLYILSFLYSIRVLGNVFVILQLPNFSSCITYAFLCVVLCLSVMLFLVLLYAICKNVLIPQVLCVCIHYFLLSTYMFPWYTFPCSCGHVCLCLCTIILECMCCYLTCSSHNVWNMRLCVSFINI